MSPITDGLTGNSGENQISNKNSQQLAVAANAGTLQTIATTSTITTTTVTTAPRRTTAVAAITSTKFQLFGEPNVSCS